jgi:meso-butanediol dehydrogenase/(S,S)-butanediol dehydrogenase/diacetyl reductase
MTLQNQVVVITGASSGIGAALAAAFVKEGAQVALLARRGERLAQLASRFGAERALAIPTDVADPDSVMQAQAQVLARWRQVHVLVNNAGVYPPDGPMWETSPEDWRRTFDINVNGVFYCMRAFLPAMLAQDYGRIINISSSMVDTPRAAAYSMSKNAVDLMTAILARELRPLHKDVIVSSLDPGWVRSEMSPEAPDDPNTVVPRALELATLPKGAPSGKKWQIFGR